jgi:hypothetical protein
MVPGLDGVPVVTQNPDEKFASDALNASLTLMSILVAVITIVAIEYKNVRSDPALADPIYRCVIATTGAAAFSGLIAFLSLLHLRRGIIHVRVLVWLFGTLIVGMVAGIIWVVSVLVS